jgi:DNA polymerase elongation subunit (family B)
LSRPAINVLLLDIETAPHVAYVWSLFDTYVPIDRVVSSGYTLCFSAKWLHERETRFHSVQKDGMKGMLKAAHALLDEADVVIHYNGKKFDIPTLQREFVKAGMRPPSPFHQVDLYHVVRKQFRFASNKLDFVAQELGLPTKVAHKGMKLWRECMAGVAAAWKTMERYNRRDTNILSALYKRLLPWIPTHPNVALWMEETEEPKCRHCGSTHLRFKGYKRTSVLSYKQYVCLDCGTWQRSRQSTGKRKDILA